MPAIDIVTSITGFIQHFNGAAEYIPELSEPKIASESWAYLSLSFY
jgi:hypothetical protein